MDKEKVIKDIPENVKRINAYRLQYWLYAILAKRFGASVKFKRDSLRHIYDMHRHCFNVSGVPLKTIRSYLEEVLISHGYKKDSQNMRNHFSKTYDYGTHIYEVNINLSDYHVDSVGVFPTVYKRLVKNKI